MYEMYPATWPTVDQRERKTARRRRPSAPAAETRAVQEAMNRRDNGGEPKK